MKQYIVLSSLIIIFFGIFFIPKQIFAIEDPRSAPNNKFGIHILFPSEIYDASSLINSSGGEWGYVTIPIQVTDRDLKKWQIFMDDAKKNKVIPIIRLATEPDARNTSVWRIPNETDLLDLANFLNSLDWPTGNRYVIFFNETNRDDEWGGQADPVAYTHLLSYGIDVFKKRNQDFFIIAGGFDNASINGNGAIDKLSYIKIMEETEPGIFNKIDGYSSHSYPNPDFSQHPLVNTATSVHSYKFETDLIANYTEKSLPIFITETGWKNNKVSDLLQSQYYKLAFDNIWSDPNIVAVTPFLLHSSGAPFDVFSFLDVNYNKTAKYTAYQEIKKTKGEPVVIPNKVLSASTAGSLPKIKYQKKQKDLLSIKAGTGMLFRYLFSI